MKAGNPLNNSPRREHLRASRIFRLCLLPLAAVVLAACNEGSGSGPTASSCPEKGFYACKTGATEPLYTFQWALKYDTSYFKDFPETFGGGLDLNVEPVHRLGIKGQGVNVLVLDSGTDLHNEDLAPNADFSMSWNFTTKQHDPYPDVSDRSNAHGTAVAGMIAAAQNGKGVMGIAPQARIGGANFLDAGTTEVFAAYGGASWSSKAHIFNASYGKDKGIDSYETEAQEPQILALRSLKKLRDGKGAVFIKSAGNSFTPGLCGSELPYYDCTNPANDISALESNVILIAALDAKGSASSYSSAGPTVWVTGMGGEFGGSGNYGEGGGPSDGPTIFSTDVRGCVHGFSYTGARTPFMRGQTIRNGVPDNPDCDYAYMNGTSSAAPTISGVAALMLSANPALTWRDVRDILRLSARKVDADHLQDIPLNGPVPYGAVLNLATNQPMNRMGSVEDLKAGSTVAPMNLGWQKNGAGLEYSDWYGFGVPDAQKAVALAQAYARDPARSRSADVVMPAFKSVALWQRDPLDDPADPEYQGMDIRIGDFPYGVVTRIAQFTADPGVVDQLQVRMTGTDVCLGSLGIAARSPAGTVSMLRLPNDHFRAFGWDTFAWYTLGSFAFYGEAAAGQWELLAVAATPDDTTFEVSDVIGGKRVYDQSTLCPSRPSLGPADFGLLFQARIISQ